VGVNKLYLQLLKARLEVAWPRCRGRTSCSRGVAFIPCWFWWQRLSEKWGGNSN